MIIFQFNDNKETTESHIFFSKLRIIPIFVFDNYYHWKKKLEMYFFFVYMKVICYVKYSTRLKKDFLFQYYYFSLLFKI